MPKVRKHRGNSCTRSNPLYADVMKSKGIVIADGQQIKKTNCKLEECKCVGENDEVEILSHGLSTKLLKLVEEQKYDEGLQDSECNGDAVDCGVEDGFVLIDVEDADEEEEERYLKEHDEAIGQVDNALGTSLGNMLFKKLNVRFDRTAEQPTNDHEQLRASLGPKVIEVYTAMAEFLKRYKSGKIPKAFKVVPRLRSWEEVLLLTEPQTWSPQATREATKIFSSSLKEAQAQRFFCLILLPAVREDIQANGKLNCHYYHALKKAVFKPGAFFKGIFLPLALNGCTLRESAIVSSIVAKVSIPVLHGAAAVVRLAGVPPGEWLPSISKMMLVLLDKKYSLPIQAIEECVDHFFRFAKSNLKLPLIWHQCLLVLIQRYKVHLTNRHRLNLRDLLKVHFHEKVGIEIRKELNARDPATILAMQQTALAQLEARRAEEMAVDLDPLSSCKMYRYKDGFA